MRTNILAFTSVAISSLFILAEPAAAATDPLVTCQARKLKSAGTFAKKALACSSKAALQGVSLDAECTAKVSAKLADAFVKAEQGGCAGPSDGVGARLTLANLTFVDEILPAGLGSAAEKCASSKLKASGAYASSFLKAEAKHTQKPDAAKRSESLAKARAKLDDAFAKADDNGSCTAAFTSTQADVVVASTVSTLLDCIVAAAECSGTSETVPGGGAVTTDTDLDGASAQDPAEAKVVSPNAGSVVIVKSSAANAPAGLQLLGNRFDIAAPSASPSAPLVLEFLVDGSEVIGLQPDELLVFRDDVAVPDCTGAPGQASPDPCVSLRDQLADDYRVTVLTSDASAWYIGVSILCPTSMRLTSRADDGVVTTGSKLEIGWAGFSHSTDPIDDAEFRIGINCGGGATPPNCGDCEVLGLRTSPDNCRCSNGNETVCDEVNAADMDDCGGAMCLCYAASPQPLLGAGTAVCLTPFFASDVIGTWNPSTGSGTLQADQRWRAHLGTSLETPCPVCTGDTVVNDGVKDGTCVGGKDDGESCDIDGIDPVLASGGGTSLDCFPNPLHNVSGLGLFVELPLTTGSSSLLSTLPCSNPLSILDCPCAVCSFDGTVPCRNDAECAAVSAGTCNSVGSGEPYYPNGCDDGVCVDAGGEQGECQGTPTEDSYCDGVTRVDGDGLMNCGNNTDCANFGPAYGNCTLVETRRCFLDPIEAVGMADPAAPLLAASGCVAGSVNGPINDAYSLPGPVRLRTRFAVSAP